MKPLLYYLITTSLLCTILFSCSNDENDFYINEINKQVDTKNVIHTRNELEIVDLVNQFRKSINIPELQTLKIISGVADNHTRYMVESGQVSHDNFENRVQYLMDNASAKSVGENVAFGYNSTQSVFNGWLNSEEHRKVIENPIYTHVGISIEINSDGRNYFTQIFIKKN